MTPERWDKISRIYQSATEVDAGRRAVFLQEACDGDDALLQELKSLLANHERAGAIARHWSHFNSWRRLIRPIMTIAKEWRTPISASVRHIRCQPRRALSLPLSKFKIGRPHEPTSRRVWTS
jgi:hypothetical protein